MATWLNTMQHLMKLRIAMKYETLNQDGVWT
jgi:hypothetical protein